MKNRPGAYLFGAVIGLLVATFAYRWITDPVPRAERRLEESVVAAARGQVAQIVDAGELEFVDPLAADRKVGKAYVYRHGAGWQVSGHYRRNATDAWHPFLATLDASHRIEHLKIRDPALAARPGRDPVVEVVP
jgi:hypothetical protein